MKIKRFLTIAFIAIFFVMLNNSKVYASSTTASNKTFDIKGLDYIADYFCNDDKSDILISGSKYDYGNIALWSALYTKYVSESDSKYYFVFVEAKVSSNTETLKGGYYRMVNKQMIVDVKANYDDDGLRFIRYVPESYGGFSVTETVTNTLEFNQTKTFEFGDSGFSGGISLGIVGGVSWSQSIYKDNVIMTPKSEDYTVNLTYNFYNVTNKNVNKDSPLRGDCIQRSIFIYELQDYSTNKKYEEELNFEINYQGFIQKVACHIFGCTGYEILDEEIKHKYSCYGRLA